VLVYEPKFCCCYAHVLSIDLPQPGAAAVLRHSSGVVVDQMLIHAFDLQVCVVDLAESDWQMLPRQARSISSDQVQMQHQQSLVRLVEPLHAVHAIQTWCHAAAQNVCLM